MKPSDVVKNWIEKFNNADAEGLACLYAPDAINDQIVFSNPLKGRKAIKEMFEIEFSRATMVCIEERIYECGDTAILQWRDPLATARTSNRSDNERKAGRYLDSQ